MSVPVSSYIVLPCFKNFFIAWAFLHACNGRKTSEKCYGVKNGVNNVDSDLDLV